MREGRISYGADIIPFAVIERPAHKTLGIEVHPDGRVIVLAPASCDDATIADKVRLRADWISRQQAMFSQYDRQTAPRRYVSGEAHRYLGRQYRLRLLPHQPTPNLERIKLTRSEIIIEGSGELSPERVKALLQQWYWARANEIYEAALADVFQPFVRQGFQKPRITVRAMKSRWGSLSPKGRMTLNVRLVQTPRLCIEYVIVHELCHLAHRAHNSAFFAMLGWLMPDWLARKRRLEQALP